MSEAPPRRRRHVRKLHLILVAGALVLVGVGIALQGLSVGVAAVIPLALASYLGISDDRRAARPPLRR